LGCSRLFLGAYVVYGLERIDRRQVCGGIDPLESIREISDERFFRSPFYDIEYDDGPPQTYPIGDRREELVRVLLASIDVRPAGETIEQSFDRKATLDSVERSKVMQATIAAEKRAREIREAMARKAALESASRYGE